MSGISIDIDIDILKNDPRFKRLVKKNGEIKSLGIICMAIEYARNNFLEGNNFIRLNDFLEKSFAKDLMSFGFVITIDDEVYFSIPEALYGAE